MGTILREAGEGRFLSLKELHEAIPHGDKCSYGAMRLSLDRLEEAGLIVRERVTGTTKKAVTPTDLGFKWFRPLRE
jgi:DNA-binding PadR family transcriptional regulator